MTASRREFVRNTAATLALGTPLSTLLAQPDRTPEILVRSAIRPVVISDFSGWEYRNGGRENAVERAFRGIVAGEDVLDACIAGVNIPELDPLEMGIGYGALPNADGVVQLDASCMHGPKRRAGAVAAIEGVRTPSLVARAVMDYTDHHLISGAGAREFARALGFSIEDDLNTPASRKAWLEWKRRVDAEHWLDPDGSGRKPRPRHERDPGNDAAHRRVTRGLSRGMQLTTRRPAMRRLSRRASLVTHRGVRACVCPRWAAAARA